MTPPQASEAAVGGRDPRVDPLPGDVTKYPGGETYTVREVRGGYVYYTSGEGDDSIDIDNWRDAAKNDEVLNTAPLQAPTP